MIYKGITKCRFDGSTNLTSVLDLGTQVLTGVFPKPEEKVESGPLELVFAEKSCLLQLKHTYSPEKMYGMNYGYRSGLNQSMITHLSDKAHMLEKQMNLKDTDVVLDIGSNDGTYLKSYQTKATKIGIDPTGIKFRKYYTDDIILISDFFSKKAYNTVEKHKAKIITSIAMFYDLEEISPFVADIVECLDDEGIWHFEQSYMPSMIQTMSFDTVCHEHTEYYSMLSISKILNKFDMEIADVTINKVNGGSFAVTAVKRVNKTIDRNKSIVESMISKEYEDGYDTVIPYLQFAENVKLHKNQLLELIYRLKNDGSTIYGYGASTKGNVLLQYCGLTSNEITAIAEVNEDKFGCETPGTHIPIISEKQAKENNPDYFLVLPWHFKDGILNREKDYLASGGKFIFPCPQIQIVQNNYDSN